MDPTRLSMPSCLAGLMVTIASASVSLNPPYFMALAASVFRWRINSASSLFSADQHAVLSPDGGVVRNGVERLDLIRPPIAETSMTPAPCGGNLLGDLITLQTV